MSSKNLQIITKIVLIYSLFYIAIKIIAVIRGAWLEANLLLAVPFVLLGVWGAFLLKRRQYSWFYAAIGVLIIVLIRVYEKELAVTLNSYFIR